MSFRLVTPPATEPLTIAEVKTHLRLSSGNLEPAPATAPAAALGSGPGNVDNGAHRYAVVFVTADGHTEVGPVSAPVTVIDQTANGKVALSSIPLGSALVTSRSIYRTAADTLSPLLYAATIADNVTTAFLDNIADASLGAGAPVVNTTSDPQIARWISSARKAAESILRRALITQQWKLTLDRFPGDGWIGYAIWGGLGGQGSQYPGYLGPLTIPTTIRDQILVPLPPLQSVDSIKYLDMQGVQQTLDPSLYIVDAASEPARITPPVGGWWPPTQERIAAVEVMFTCGYGDTAASVEETVRDWMLLRIGAAHENREQFVIDTRITAVELPYADGLLDHDRLYSF